MDVNLRTITGNWNNGVVLDKHTVCSVLTGQNAYGYNVWDTTRTEVGEALYQLKYQSDWTKVQPLAQCLHAHAYPLFNEVGLIVPMPASNVRPRQPVTAIAEELARLADVPCFNGLLVKAAGGASLKNLKTEEEKALAIGNRFSVNDVISNQGKWNVLVVDDLFNSGTTMRAACTALRGYNKINNIYVAALTWS